MNFKARVKIKSLQKGEIIEGVMTKKRTRKGIYYIKGASDILYPACLFEKTNEKISEKLEKPKKPELSDIRLGL